MLHLNIGSNLGDSEAIIAEAAARLQKLLPDRRMRVSAPFRGPAWGYESQNEFVNVGVAFEGSQTWTTETLDALYTAIHAIETDLGGTPHRNPDGSYCDRNLDIDVIDADGTVITTPLLTLPHPRAHLRDFVLIPLLELEPDWTHPVLGKLK